MNLTTAWMSALVCGMAMGQAPAVPEVMPPVLPVIDVWEDFPKFDASRPFRPLDGAWPARVPAGDVKGIVVPVTTPILRPEGWRVGDDGIKRGVGDVPDAKVLLGESPMRVLLEGTGAFVVRASPYPEGERVPRRQQNLAELTFRFVSAQQEGPEVVRIERTWFAYFGPIRAAGEAPPAPQGVVLLMPGMFGTPEPVLNGLTAALRKRGLGVLRMIAQPGRFTERLTLELDPEGDVQKEVRRATLAFDSREAECAYAAQGAWAHLTTAKPETAGVPRAIIGFSAGAITLPTVVAREPDKYAAAVMVGGGCHWWLLNEKSNYRTMIDAIDVKWASGPSEADLVAARAAYLDASLLDPFNTAQALRGKPTIVIQGVSDLAVPSPLGDCLWERAGKPERWLVEGGHEVLFMQLSGYYERIGEWLEKVMAPRE